MYMSVKFKFGIQEGRDVDDLEAVEFQPVELGLPVHRLEMIRGVGW